MRNYLMLDKDDVTVSHGSISKKELLKEMTINELNSMLNNFKLYKGKYILVEDE